MTEIQTRNGHRFTIKDGHWTPVEPNEADRVIAEMFDWLCQKDKSCKEGHIFDRDYCYANLVVREFKGKITKHDPPPRAHPHVAY